MLADRQAAFPYSGTLREKLRSLLRYALYAPSTHNTQPWIFKLTESSVEVYADPARSLTHLDPDRRERTMSVGAAIDHLRLAMICHLLEPRIELACRGSSELLATISSVGNTVPTSGQLRTFGQVAHRHTYRGAFDNVPIEEDMLEELAQAANDGDTDIVFVGGRSLRRQLSEMVRVANEALVQEPEYRKEAARWVRGSRASVDGIPSRALGPALKATVASWPVNRSAGSSIAQSQVEEAPAVAVVCTRGDEVCDWIKAGMAVSRLTLAAALRGIRCSFYLQPFHFPPFRYELKEALPSAGHPQIMIRLGYAAEGVATPRRSLEDVLVERHSRREKPIGGPR